MHLLQESVPVDFLQPFRTQPAVCPTYETCLSCVGDASCGWANANGTCVSRFQAVVNGTDAELVVGPRLCSACGDKQTCQECHDLDECEWDSTKSM